MSDLRDQESDWQRKLAAARTGDKRSLDEILAEIRPALLEHARRVGAGRNDASDKAQQALLHIHEKLHTFRGKTQREFIAWSKVIVKNDVLVDARRRRPALHSLDDLVASSLAVVELLATNSPTPSSQVARAELADLVRQAIERMELPQRNAVLLRYGKGLKFEEIAKRLGIPKKRATRYVHDALISLGESFGHDD